jgi:hypothetical protein
MKGIEGMEGIVIGDVMGDVVVIGDGIGIADMLCIGEAEDGSVAGKGEL